MGSEKKFESTFKDIKSKNVTQILENTTYNYKDPINNIPQEEQNKIEKLIEKYQDASAVLFMGPTGTGKTTIIANIAKNAFENGSAIYNFIKLPTNSSLKDVKLLEAIVQDAVRVAQEKHTKSYILLNELHYFGFAKKPEPFRGYPIFLDLLENSEVKRYVNFLATTNKLVDTKKERSSLIITEEFFDKEIFRPGRFDLEVLLDEKAQDNFKFERIKQDYEKTYPERPIRIDNID